MKQEEKHVDWVWYADSIENIKNPIKVKKTFIEEKYGFKWVEAYQFPEGTDEKTQALHQSLLLKEIRKLYPDANPAKTEQKLMLCDMGKYGLGVVAKEAIEPGEVIIYTGKFCKQENTTSVEYTLNTEFGEHIVDAEEFGNISRLVQHAPGIASLQLTFEPEAREQLSLGNLNSSCLYISDTNMPVMIYVFNKQVHELAMVAKDYGEEYWKMLGEEPALFNKNMSLYTGKLLCKPSQKPMSTLAEHLHFYFLSKEQETDTGDVAFKIDNAMYVIKKIDIHIVQSYASIHLLEHGKTWQKFWNDHDKFKEAIIECMKGKDKPAAQLFILQKMKFAFDIGTVLASYGKELIERIDQLTPEQSASINLFKQELQTRLDIAMCIIQTAVFKHTFYIGTHSYRREEFSKFFDKNTAFYQICKENIPKDFFEQMMALGKKHPHPPAKNIQTIQTLALKPLALELMRLTGVAWKRHTKGKEIWIKATDTVLDDVRSKLQELKIAIKVDKDSCIVLDATKLRLDKLKDIEVSEKIEEHM